MLQRSQAKTNDERRAQTEQRHTERRQAIREALADKALEFVVALHPDDPNAKANATVVGILIDKYRLELGETTGRTETVGLSPSTSNSRKPSMSSPANNTVNPRALLRRQAWTDGLSRPEQRLPTEPWRTCLIMGGRGSGKTRAGAEGAADLAVHSWGLEGDAAIVAPTFGAARDVCVEGPSGLLRTLAGLIDKWNRSQGQLHLADGSTIFCDGADDGALRIQGLNLKWVWCDEAGLWRITQARMLDNDRILIPAWDESIQPALRLPPSKAIITGTPKGRRGPLIKRMIDDPTVPVARMRTRDNYTNLSPQVVEQLEAMYGGTSLGAQELEGHLVDAVEGALWNPNLIDQHRLTITPPMDRIVVGVDPPGGATEAGIVAAGIIHQNCPCGSQARGQAHAAVIDDRSPLEGHRTNGVTLQSPASTPPRRTGS